VFSSFQIDTDELLDFFARVIQMKDGTKIKLQLLGNSGQERQNATFTP